MNNKIIGKVKRVSPTDGDIVAMDGTYLFTLNDLEDQVKEGDVVSFRGEIIHNTKRAYFVRILNKDFKSDKILVKENDN